MFATIMTPATAEKREQLKEFVRRVLEPEPAVKGVVGIGSIATGHMRPDSDVDVVLFLDPLDLYIVPAEAIWRPEDDTYHSIFAEGVEGLQLDFIRLGWQQWADPEFEWPEARRAELASGWPVHDPSGETAKLIAVRTDYPEDVRLARLDEAIVWLDQHLGGDQPRRIWDKLGPLIAHDRLEAAYDVLVAGLFATNRHWRAWRNREMEMLLHLPWLPDEFAERALVAANAPAVDYDGFAARADMLRTLFQELLDHLIADGVYSAAAVDQAFIRSAEEPGRAWNMEEWNKFHRARATSSN